MTDDRSPMVRQGTAVSFTTEDDIDVDATSGYDAISHTAEENIEHEDNLTVQSLKFGDSIILYDANLNGLVYCDASGSYYSGLMLKSRSTKSSPRLGNIKSAVFTVLAQTKYRAQKNFRLAFEKIKEKDPDLTLAQALLSPPTPEFQSLNELRVAEETDNELEQERRMGDDVVYGQVVQLKHAFSGEFVRVSNAITSATEPSNMRIELDADINRSSFFKIMPRYKVRAEGERVRMGDQIVFESLKTVGQFIHSTSSLSDEVKSVAPDSHELNISVTPSSFTLYPHLQVDASTASASSEGDEEDVNEVEAARQAAPIRAGEFIQLFHKEISAYLCAEGTPLEEPREDVHMRVRENDPRRPHRLLPPTSAVSFWQIELDDDPSSGECVEWNTKIRLKHATTQRYLMLCATGDYLPSAEEEELEASGSNFEPYSQAVAEATGGELQLSLTSDPHHPDAVFLLTPVLQEKSRVENGTYCRIQHCATSHWLHASKSRDVERKWQHQLAHDSLNTDLHKEIMEIQWDQAPLKMATCSRNRMFDDAFILQRVSDESANYVAYVSGMVRVMDTFLRMRREKRLNSIELASFSASIAEYAEFCLSNGLPNRIKQKLLRNFGVVELIVEMIAINLKAFSAAPAPLSFEELRAPSATKHLIIELYTLLGNYAKGDSRKNELYAARHISFFITQLGCGLEMEPMYTELVNDNQKIVDVIGQEEIEMFISLLRKDKDPRYLAFLSNLCSVEDAADGENQELICKLLLECENPPVFFTEVRDQDVYINTGNADDWYPLQDFCRQTRSSADPLANKLYAFLTEQLRLFGWLCLQRCDVAIETITKRLGYLTWEECFLCASDERLPVDLRQIYVELMLNLFIDVGDNADILEEVQLCFRWDQLSNKPYAAAAADPTLSLSGARMTMFPQLNDWIYAFLSENQELEARLEEDNDFIAAVLRLTKILIKFGYYCNPDDIERLMFTIRPILSGFNDIPASTNPGDRSKTLTKSKRAPKKKKGVRFDDPEAQHIVQWRQHGRYLKSAANRHIFNVKVEALGVIDAVINFALSLRIEMFCYDFRQLVGWSGERRDTRARQSRAGHINHFKDMETEGPTMDFATMQSLKEVRDHGVKNIDSSLTRRVRLYLDELFDRCNFIVPGWRPVASSLRNSHVEPGDEGKEDLVEILLDLAKYNSATLVCKSLQLLDRLYSFTQHTFEYSDQAYLLLDADSIDFNEKMRHYMPVLRRLGAGQIEDSEIEMGAFNKILADITNSCKVDRTCPHAVNQAIVINHGILNVLFDVLAVEDQPAEVLTHVFNCLEVLANDNTHVQDEFFERLDKILTLETVNTGWEPALAGAVCEVFADNKELSLKLSGDQIEKMLAILIRHSTDLPEMVLTLSSIVNCEELGVPLERNQNLIMKSLMKYFDELVAITHIVVAEDEQTTQKRLALLRYSGNDPEMQRLQRYHANLVGLIAQCAEGYNRFIESTCMTLFTIDELLQVLVDDKIPVFVKSEYMRFFNFVYLETTASKIEAGTSSLYSDHRLWHALKHLASRNIAPLYVERGPEYPLLPLDDENFAFEAYIPFLGIVVSDVFDKALYPAAVPVLRDIGAILSQFCERALDKIYNHEHLKELSISLINLHNTDNTFVPAATLQKIGNALSMHEASRPKTPRRKNYEQKYAKQQEANDLLNIYALDMAKAYNGVNEIRVQLPSHKGADDKDERYCEDEDEDEPLPLGPDFQYFVDLFVKYEVHSGKKVGVSVRDDVKSLVASLLYSRKYSASLETKDHELQEVLDVRCLQLLRTIMHNQIVTEQETLRFQNAIARYNAVLPVADMLSVPHDLVVREALAMLIKVLEGGNKIAQESFYQHFIGTREETFFYDVQNRIRRSIASKKEIRSLVKAVHADDAKDNAIMGTMTIKSNLQGIDQGTPPPEGADGIELQDMSEKSSDKGCKPCGDDDELGITDEGNIELVLRVLQYMCEGHNFKLQEYLRHQPDNIHPINLVSVTVDFLASMMEEVNADTIELITQTVETLVEFAQGCPKNQQSIFDSRVVDSLNQLLRTPDFHTICDPPKVAKLHLGCANLVLAMLENSDDATQKLALEIEQTLDIHQVFVVMKQYQDITAQLKRGEIDWQFADPDDEEDDIVDPCEVAFALLTIIIRLKDFTHVHYEEIPKYNPAISSEGDVDHVFESMEAEISSIEILRDGEVHRVHFRNKWSGLIRDDVKETMKWNVDRGSPAEKFGDYLERVRTIIADIRYHESVKNFSVFTYALLHYDWVWRNAMLVMTYVLNLLILSTWEAPRTWNTARPDFNTSESTYNSLLTAFGIIHLIATVLVSISYFVLRPLEFSQITTLFGLLDVKHDTKRNSSSGGDDDDENELDDFDDEDDRTHTPILSGAALYYVLLIIMSVLGLSFYGYFYCFHLLHLIVGNDILLRVLRSVTKNGTSLLWVAALMVIVIYIYSLISFAFLRKNFDESEGAYCQSAFQCFITSLRLGLLSGGGLGEALPAITHSFYEPGWRTVFDLSFFIIITTIALNVVFGIIVDSFSELRDEKYQTIELMEGECFICGLKAYDFERFTEGFHHHVKHEHRMWDYVAYFLHLIEKDHTEFNSHEQYVYESFVRSEYNFFPVNHALSLRGKRESGVEERLEHVENALQELLRRMHEESAERQALAKKKAIQESKQMLMKQATRIRRQATSTS